MKLWLCGMVLAFATFVRIETKSTSEHRIHTRGLDDTSMPFDGEYHMSSMVETRQYVDDASIFKPFAVDLEGEYTWDRIYHINNRGKNNEYHENRKIKKVVKTSYSELTKSVYDASLKINHNVQAGGKFEIISASVNTSINMEVSTAYQRIIEKKTEITTTEEFERDFKVLADSKGDMFRLHYNGPGVDFATDTVSTEIIPYDKVHIKLMVKRVPMIADIKVVYTNQSVDRPDNVITETNGGSADLNSGHGGYYVWLVPVWTDKVSEAVTGMAVVVQTENNLKYVDLAAGALGKYRFLKMLHADYSHKRIKRVGLLRRKGKYVYGERHDFGWDDCTGDINELREGDWLHLCWNYVSIASNY